MECTAQAFEEMQEQNIRLLMQLKVVGVGRVGGGDVEEASFSYNHVARSVALFTHCHTVQPSAMTF